MPHGATRCGASRPHALRGSDARCMKWTGSYTRASLRRACS
jgi:hypothetical protein